MTYSEKLKSPQWQRARLKVFERDAFTCRDCGAKDAQLHVHHCGYLRGNPWDTPPILLLTLCDPCHDARQTLEDGLRIKIALLCSRMSAAELREFSRSVAGKCIEHGPQPVADGVNPQYIPTAAQQALDAQVARRRAYAQ